MSDFGDAEPEDAWHPGDPTGVLLDNICRRCSILGESRRDPPPVSDLERVVDLEHRLHRLVVRRRDMSDLEQVRVDLIAQDVAFLRTRLEAERG